VLDVVPLVVLRVRLMLCRFSQIQSTCTGSLDVSPFGVDSVFKLGSTNFNPDLFDPEGQQPLQSFNICIRFIAGLSARTNSLLCTIVYNLLHVCGAAKHQKTCNKQHLSQPVFGTATLCNVHIQPLHVGSMYDDDPHVHVDDKDCD